MSDAATGQPPPPAAHPEPARLAAADALRDLIHALVAHDGDDALLHRVASEATALRHQLESAPLRARGEGDFPRWGNVRGEGAVLSCVPDCMVAGPANPLSARTRIERRGQEAVLHVVLGAGFDGLPGRAHGGIVASLFDEAMGQALYMDGLTGYTAWLRVDYKAPVVTGVPIEIRARLAQRDGRKFLVDAELTSDGQPGPTAQGLFIAPRSDYEQGLPAHLPDNPA